MMEAATATIETQPDLSLKEFSQLNQREQRVIKDIMKELLVKY